MRGEYSISHTQISYDLELPPRARRILVLTIWLTRLIGTTSACAENTGASGLMGVLGGNYLRVRGEYCRAS